MVGLLHLNSSLRTTTNRCWTRWAIALPLTVLSILPASAEYYLQVGDILEFSVAGVPDLKERLSVGIDGEVSVPLIGQVHVAGLSLGEFRKKIVGTLPNLIFTQRTSDGREVARVISANEIAIRMVEYRPIYLRGDVAKPGEQAFRPGMIVRQAIALAGGFDILRYRMNNPVLEAAELRAEYMSLWTSFAREQARLWRIKSELGDIKDGQDPALQAPIAPDVLDRLLRNEQDQYRTRKADLEKEKSHLQEAIRKADFQLRTLSEKRKSAETGRQDDVSDLDKVRELFNRGITPTTRLSEARRAVSFSETQVLQTITEASQVERQRDIYSRQLDRVDDERRMELLKELQETNVALAQIQAKIQSTSEKLLYTSSLQSQLLRGTGGKPDISIYRISKGGREHLLADEDAELHPGDVVNITLQVESVSGIPIQ